MITITINKIDKQLVNTNVINFSRDWYPFISDPNHDVNINPNVWNYLIWVEKLGVKN